MPAFSAAKNPANESSKINVFSVEILNLLSACKNPSGFGFVFSTDSDEIIKSKPFSRLNFFRAISIEALDAEDTILNRKIDFASL